MAEFLELKRNAFINGPAQCWGERPLIHKDVEGGTRKSIADTFHNTDFVSANLFPCVKDAIFALHNLSQVCKAFAVGTRAVSGHKIMFYTHVVLVRGQYYEVLLAKGPENSIKMVRYK